MLIFEQIAIGGRGQGNFAYLIGDKQTSKVAVVDVGFQTQRVLNRIEKNGLHLDFFLGTHDAADHVGAAPRIRESTGAKLAAHPTVRGVDIPLRDGDVVNVGKIQIQVIYTPGHSLDSLCFLVDGTKLLTGDTLFVEKIPALKSLQKSEAKLLFQSLQERVLTLDGDVEVWPGHQVGDATMSTIEQIRLRNPMLQLTSFDEFWRQRNMEL